MKTSLKQSRHKLDDQQEIKANPDGGLWIRASKAVIYAGRRISHAAKVLYVILRDYQGEHEYAWPSVATLATDMECSERYVQELLRELEAVGAIEIVERAGWVSLYRVCLIELKSGQPTNDQLPKFSREVEPGAKLPLNYSSPLPPNYSSPELEPLELDQIVCENTRTSENEKRNKQGNIPPEQPIAASIPTYQDMGAQATRARQNTPKRDISPKPGKGYASIARLFNTRSIADDHRPIHSGEQAETASNLNNQAQQIPTTIDTTTTDHTHTQPAAGDMPATAAPDAQAQAEVIDLLKAQGMATLDACRLAVQPHNTKAHVQDWIAYTRSHAHNPAGYLVRVLDRQDAQPPAPKTKKTPTRRARTQPTDPQTAPIDFTKYTDNGKYSFLTNHTTPAPATSAPEYLDLNNSNSGQHFEQAEPTQPTTRQRIWINAKGVIRPAKAWEKYEPSQIVPDPYKPPTAQTPSLTIKVGEPPKA